MPRWWCRAAAVLCMVLAWPAASAAAWLELRTSSFLVLGAISERELRDLARRLEQLREVLERIAPDLSTASPVPTVVIVLPSAHAFEAFQPVRNGRRATLLAGYFQPGDTVNYIALHAGDRDAVERIAFHEYVHLLVSNSLGDAPGWLSEGLAQLYETAQISRDGRTVSIGAPPALQARLLRELPPATLESLMRETQLAELHDGLAPIVAYAHAWSLVHYLTFGNSARAGQLRDYAGRLAAGHEAAAAFDTVFGAAAELDRLEGELSAYVTQRRFAAQRYRFAEPATGGAIPPARAVSDSDVEPHLAGLLARAGREPEARQRLEALLRAEPGHAQAAAALGAIELRALRFDAALAMLERASALAPRDAAIQSAFGTALYGAAMRHAEHRADRMETLARAHAVLSHAVSLDARSAPTLMTLAQVELARGGDTSRARELLEAAVALAPARKEYRRALDRARAGLPPEAGPPPDVSAPGPRLALRVLRTGEQRVPGRFRRIDCDGATPQYVFDTDGGPLRLTVPLQGAQIIKYGPGPERLGCGTVPGTPHVLVTYVPATDAGRARGAAGDVVAIEIVPEGYRP